MSNEVWAVIAGGGTSGHVHPALAIADELVRRGRTSDELHFIGSSRGLEAELVPEHGYALTSLPGRGIQRAINLQNVKSLLALGSAALQSLRALRKLRPAVVISVGGYASLPAVAAAAALRIPIVVMEQNTVPGAANRFASRWAKVCCVSFADTDLPNAVHTGNPSLPTISTVDRTNGGPAARTRLGVEPGRRLIAAFGGSLGARRINEAVIAVTDYFAERSDLTIRHVIGDRDWSLFGEHVVEGALQYQPIRYERAMADIYAGAEFVISRAGATSVSEIAQTATPAIFVPLPGAPGDHQTRNAQALTTSGGGLLVKDSDLDATTLIALIEELLADSDRVAAMGAAAGRQARPRAAFDIADLVEKHAKQR